MGKTAICYCRTSTKGQAERENILYQINACRRIVERHGLTLLPYGPKADGWVMDDGVTGTLLDGRSMATLLNDINSGVVRPDLLVVYSASRISRVDRVSKNKDKVQESYQAAARIQSILDSNRVEVVDEEGQMGTGSLQFQLKSMLANAEFALIRGRTMNGKAQRLSEGKFAKGGKPPYGYSQVPINGLDRKQGFELVPHAIDADRLRQILEWFVESGVTEAARRATEAAWETPMASTERANAAKDWTPTRWSPVSVQHLVRNAAAYLGSSTYVFDGSPHTINYEAIVTPKLYAQVQQRQSERSLKKRATLLSTGFVDCECGSHVHAKATHRHHLARCNNNCGCMRQSAFDEHLWTATLCRLLQIRKAEGDSKKAADFDQTIQTAKERVQAFQKRVDTLLDAYTSEDITKDDWKIANGKLQSERGKAVAHLEHLQGEQRLLQQRRATEATVEARVKAVINELGQGTPTLERKRAILRDILVGSRVIVAWPAKQQGKRLDGSPSKNGTLSPFVSFSLPNFGTLPAIKVSTQTEIWDQMLGGIEGGFHRSTVDLGSQEISEAKFLVKLHKQGGKVTSRTVLEDGTIKLSIETPDTYSP